MRMLRNALLALLPGMAAAQICQPPVDRKAAEVPLCLVAEQVTRTLDAFNADADRSALPRLSSVAFDFRTSAATTAGFSFNILVFNLGANREKDATNEVVFTYTVPPPPAAQSRTHTPPPNLSQTLLATLQSAAAQVRDTQRIGAATFSNLTVTLSFGVVWDASAGGTGTIGLVSLGGNVDRRRSDVQTLTLTFAP